MLLSGPGAPREGGWLDERLPLREVRRAVRGWRRTRPFWGGLLLVLGGAELLVVPLSPLTVLVSLGLGGIAAIGIGIALMVAGLFLWLLPQAHHYVSVNALILSVLSFAATNLGGFLVGMLLGIVGSAMGFGWTPVPEDGQEEARRPGLRDGQGTRTLAVLLPVVLAGAALWGAAPAKAVPVAGAVGGAAGGAVGGAASGAHAAPRAPGDGPVVAARTPPTITTTLFAPKGFIVAGVRDIPTADGPLKVMVLHMNAASLTDYRLRTRDGSRELALGADTLDLSGRVTLYLTKFKGCIEGLLCLTFTPDRLPVPPLVPPFVFMTDVSAEQALVTSDVITAGGLSLRAHP
ncbi:hypothetical protein C9F11_07500 [Streptomyces sp. YIM 121038]|uniref:DUF6114 domain-containing protein n=1 Tax=Streptomyces sp. YIM 121038 TaxID=2136401 RepID=UPI00116519CE|nr:DUF6114 domain-containing protein [Streptomyces sp. YIM 121038]QCX75196.1 hypothetical protein C9F11_07500 [Streptomyces sp. YIM 121038]